MIDHEFPDVPRIERAFRAAYRTLGKLVSTEHSTLVPEENLSVTELISHFRFVVDEAEMAVAAQLGPIVSWYAPRRDDWDPIAVGVDFDEGDYGFGLGDIVLADSVYEGPDGGWTDGALDRASRAYRREAGWDFSPGAAGIWLLMLAPVSSAGGAEGDRPWHYTGHLVGFVILHDRDKDGEYESVAHIWTAAAWRRRGIALRLMAEARSRYPVTAVEGPYTEDGGAFLRAEAVAEFADSTVPTAEEVIAQVSEISRRLEGELERGDYASARASWDKLIGTYPALKDDIDLSTDPAVREPLLDVYEAAVELRIRAAGILDRAEERDDGQSDA